MITEQQRIEAIAICDQILDTCDRVKRDLTEATADLKEAIDDAIRKLQPSEQQGEQ